MLRTLSYINIALAVAYFMSYLLSSNYYTMGGIIALIVFSLLVINTVDRELRFTMVHYLLGLTCLVFAGFLIVWVINVISSSIEHNYFGNSWIYILLTVPFTISIVLQFIMVMIRKR